VKDYLGQTISPWNEVSPSNPGGEQLLVSMAPLDFGTLGGTNCVSGFTYTTVLNDGYISQFEVLSHFLDGVARHEIGHAAGLNHTGATDSFDNLTPTMSTCPTDTGDIGSSTLGWDYDTTAVSQDDWQSLQYWNDDLVYNFYHTGSANPGFENGTSFWGSESQTLSLQSGGAAGSGEFVRVTNTNLVNRLYQTSNIAPLGNGTNSLSYMVAIANIRDSNTASDKKGVTLTLNVRRVDYQPANPACGGASQYWSGRDQNYRSNVYGWQEAWSPTHYLAANSEWRVAESDETDTGQYFAMPTDWQASDVQVELHNGLEKTSDNSAQPIDVDNLRVGLQTAPLGG
jgi:hypothetical protein